MVKKYGFDVAGISTLWNPAMLDDGKQLWVWLWEQRVREAYSRENFPQCRAVKIRTCFR